MDDRIEIKNMELDDIAIVHSMGIRVKEFSVTDESSTFWPEEILEALVASEDDITLVATHQEKIIGYTIITYHPASMKATWENAEVAPEFRRAGISSAMYKLAEKKICTLGAKYICSFVEEGHNASIQMLQKEGYEKGKQYSWMYKET